MARSLRLLNVPAAFTWGATIEARTNSFGKFRDSNAPLLFGRRSISQPPTVTTMRGVRAVATMYSGVGPDTPGDKSMAERLFSACSNGRLQELDALIRLKADVNWKNAKGWTATMLAARNGHADVVARLVAAGADVNAVNTNGQTARDVAVFWNHGDAAAALSSTAAAAAAGGPPSRQKQQSHKELPQHINFFCHMPLSRAVDKRLDLPWLLTAESDPRAKYVLFDSRRLPLVTSGDSSAPSKRAPLKLATLSHKQAQKYLAAVPEAAAAGGQCRATFLGLHTVTHEPWFAAMVAQLPSSEDLAAATGDGSSAIEPMKNIREALLLGREDAAVAGMAASLIDWQTRCIYCESCGAKTQVVEGGHKRVCTTETCTVKKDIRNTSYPRIDPTVIMAVVSPDGTSILLGHGKRHPRGMWSCLAGFMEPGESVEDAVRREVFEEVGVRVGHVQYHSSQPWPFPTQLMIGCLAHATTTELTIDKKELEGAAWFPSDLVQLMSEHKHPEGFFFPPSQAIAHHLIKHWLRSPSSKM